MLDSVARLDGLARTSRGLPAEPPVGDDTHATPQASFRSGTVRRASRSFRACRCTVTGQAVVVTVNTQDLMSIPGPRGVLDACGPFAALPGVERGEPSGACRKLLEGMDLRS